MSKRFRYTLVHLFLFILTGQILFAQHTEPNSASPQNHTGHKLSLVMANSLINNSFSDQTNDIRIVPVFGFNYDYYFDASWGLGLHSDILLQQYKVEKQGSHEEIIRENPIAICGMALFKPHHRWTLMAGYGVEVEKHESFQIIRTGVEFGIDLPEYWELGFSLEFDYKIKTYSSLMFGVVFSKILGQT